MSSEGQHIHDIERLRELAEFDFSTDEIRTALDGIALQAAEAFNLPIGLVSVILDGAQVFPGAAGLSGWLAETRGTPVEWAFCKNVVEGWDPFEVSDASSDERVSTNPLVTQDGIRCYLGAPLVTSRGNRLGSLCVIGPEARTFLPEEIERLRELAAEAVRVIEASRQDMST